MKLPAYDAHERLVAPARATAELWRTLAGLFLSGLVAFGLASAFNGLLAGVAPDSWQAALRGDAGLGKTPGPTLLLLGGFGFLAIGVMVAARVINQRSPLGLIGPVALAITQFWRVLRILLVIGALILLLPPYDMGLPLEPNLPFGTWALLLPLSLCAILVQAGTEELLFRGYLQQSLAARFANPAIWMAVPSALFALGHYMPAMAGANAVPIMLWAGMFGLLMADLTARAGTLGPAIAVHLVNNITAILIVSLEGSLSGLSLFTVGYELSDIEGLRSWLVVDFVTLGISWLAARVALRR